MAKYGSFVRQIAFDLASESGAEALCVPRRVAAPIVRGRDTPCQSLAQGEATNETHPFATGGMSANQLSKNLDSLPSKARRPL